MVNFDSVRQTGYPDVYVYLANVCGLFAGLTILYLFCLNEFYPRVV